MKPGLTDQQLAVIAARIGLAERRGSWETSDLANIRPLFLEVLRLRRLLATRQEEKHDADHPGPR